MKHFKKYRNRKFYDIQKSAYTTLESIAFESLDDSVQVINSPSNEDVTEEVMLLAYLKVLSREDRFKIMVLAKDLFKNKNDTQNLNIVSQEEIYV